MGSSVALFLCIVGIVGLFFLDRDKSVWTSKGLWVSVIWISIVGSRPVSNWLGINSANGDDPVHAAEGSPFDGGIFGILLAVGIIILIGRRRRMSACLKASWPVIVYFVYCFLSISWSDYPDVAFKRWIKAIGDLVIALIVVTDPEPVEALKRLFSRVGFILFPFSVLLIKYFGDLGRGYDPDGRPMNTGVTTNKNTLGVITLVISLGALWSFLNLLRAKREPNRIQHLLARGTLLGFGVALLAMAHSATSSACFALGAVLMIATFLPLIKRRPGAVHALVATTLLAGGLTMLFGAQEGVAHALGRESNLTGRTEIWAAVLPVVPNRIVGAGFESFWLPPRLQKVWSNLSQYMQVNEAHNGYIEVYLNLGWVGVGLIAIMLISGYRGAIAAFRRNPTIGGLMLAYVAAAAMYSISEAGFRPLLPSWIFFLLAIVGSHSIPSGAVGGTRKPLHTRARRIPEPSTGHALVSAS